MNAASTPIRVERKLLTGLRDPEEVAARLQRVQAFLVENYESRAVHSVYFDSPGLECFRDHADGQGARQKLRLRWYGSLEGDASRALTKSGVAMIELKQRVGSVMRKPQTTLAIASLAEVVNLPRRSVFELAEQIGMFGAIVSTLEAVCLVSFHRRYFEVPGTGLRVTIDWAIQARRCGTFGAEPSICEVSSWVLAEVKYPVAQHGPAANLVSALGWSAVRNSKYVSAIRALGLAV